MVVVMQAWRRLCFSATLVLSVLAFIWRRLMFRTIFIAITGSVGKTSAKECLTAMLSSRFPTNAMIGNWNNRQGLASTILRTRYRHRFTVIEAATRRPGALRRAAWEIRPDVVVVLVVARTHINHFPTLEHTAAEKASLLDRLPPSGLAILNGEDPRVLAMADRCRCRVVTFGRSPRFDFWASEVSARWPSRLTFRIHTATQFREVRTNLVGEYWLSSVLGALAAAVCCGMDLKDAVRALEQAQPYRARLQPVALPCGATLLRDDENGSVTALQEALGVMKEAEVPRRIAVLGDTWDSGLGEPRARLEDLGRRVAGTVDLAVFVGEQAHYAAEALIASGMKPVNVRSISGLRETAEFLKSELRPGDLALLKGQYMQHLSRIYLAQLGPVQCWKMKCLEVTPCERCEELS